MKKKSFGKFLKGFVAVTLTLSFTPTTSFGENNLKSLDFDEKEIKQAYKEYRVKMETLKLLNGVYVSSVPRAVPLKAFVRIDLHPTFLTTIEFPSGTEILKATSSMKMKLFSYNKNLLIVQPSADETSGNGVVIYRTKNGNLGHITLFFSVLNPYKSKKGVVFYSNYVLISSDIYSPYEVIAIYKKLKGKLPEGRIIFRFKGVNYLIEKNENGNVFVDGVKYLVTPSFVRY